MNIGLVILNPDKKVVQCNDTGAALLGVPSQDAVGQPVRGLLLQRAWESSTPSEFDSLVDRIVSPDRTLTDQPPEEFEVVFRPPGCCHLAVTVFPLNEDGGSGVLIQDLTLDSGRSGKDDFISILSHELLNPITSVMGYSELLRDAPLDETQRDWLETIHWNGQRLAGLVEDLLEMTRLELGLPGGSQEIFVLGHVINEVLATTKLRSTFHEFDVRSDAQIPKVKTSRLALVGILRNLLRNAINFAPPGSTITLYARHEEKADRVVVSVEDQGQGIGPDDAGSVFTPFSRSRQPAGPSNPATSLCLHVAKTLVEEIGEEIWLESDSKKGASFHFSLSVAH